MYRQVGDLALQGMPVQLRLLGGAFHRNDNVAQDLAAVVLVDVVLTVFAHREAEYIGGGILVAVFQIQLVDAVVVHKGDADLGGTVKFFKVQHGVAAAADQNPQPGRNLDNVLVVGDQYFIGHNMRTSCLFLCGNALYFQRLSSDTARFSGLKDLFSAACS